MDADLQLPEQERRVLLLVEKEREFQNKIQLVNTAINMVRSEKPDLIFRVAAHPETHRLYLQISYRGCGSVEELSSVDIVPHRIAKLIIKMAKTHMAKIDRKIAKGKLIEKPMAPPSNQTTDVIDSLYWRDLRLNDHK